MQPILSLHVGSNFGSLWQRQPAADCPRAVRAGVLDVLRYYVYVYVLLRIIWQLTLQLQLPRVNGHNIMP
jgi:hypothetical protein